MDPPHPPSKRKRSFSGVWNRVVRRSPSPSALQQSSPAPIQSTPSPLPDDRLGLTPRSDSAPPVVHQVVAAPQALGQASLPAPGANNPTPASGSAPPAIIISPAATESSSMEVDPVASIPTDSAVDTSQPATSGAWTGLGITLRTLQRNTRLLPPLQAAIGTFIPCLDILEEAASNRREYEELATELTSLTKLLANHMEQASCTRMSSSIANVARAIEEEAKLIETKRGRGTGRRLMEANKDQEELSRYCKRIKSLFQQLQFDADLSIWDIVNSQMANTRLEGLMPVKLANYDSELSTSISRRTCTEDTRTEILAGLNDWSHDPDGADLYWMNGMAGTGKTTIACTFSESLEERKQLVASYFCTRTDAKCQEATRIIPTIAYQLARYSVPFQSALCQALNEDPDVGSKNITKQFERLLKTPLLKVKDAIPNDLVVVIDALDECDDMREVELLLSILQKSAADVPLRFFLTSRPEPEIYSRMLTQGHASRTSLHLHEVEKSLVQADIEVYLKAELEFMSPTPAQIKELVQRSGKLFIYASTLVRYIRPPKPHIDPQKRLQLALGMASQTTKQYAAIDGLYAAVLKAALDDDSEDLEAEDVEDVRQVLWTAICVQEPAKVEVLAVLTGLNEKRVISALQPLRSVLHFSETSGLVSTFHASFPDFMLDEVHSKSFFCNLAERSQLLVRRCFEVMKAQLKFNICRLESSFAPDANVDNLKERIKQFISPTLQYSCRYWGDHLRNSTYSDELGTMLNDFLSNRLLFWMEVLNLRQDMGAGAEVLFKAKLWMRISIVQPDLVKLAEDARNFVTSFASHPVSQSTPHLYISSLPFCPKSSLVYKLYWRRTRSMVVTGSAMQKRDGAALASWDSESEVNSVAYSPDGTRIVSGSDDGTIRVWSAHDGTLVAGPFEGHTDSVRSVVYSPDGTRIVSGSRDCTIRVWSAHDGTLVAGPFEGHTHWVLSVAYSPEGTRIVSGSRDCTIRVWSAHNGTLVAGPFEGHTHWVLSVAYSPDGTRIVSGSHDRTIRVWSVHDGTLVAGPFEVHTDSVRSVAYSPDGTRIVSGSDDGTIQVWSAHDGTLVAGPFEGHTDSVFSVAYSPDGTRIVSGSHDRTIRVWSAHDGTLVAGPFEGHTDSVRSVAYSPDGTRIVSGSHDRIIRVWSAHDGTLVAGPFEGHTDSVRSVAYSPDGTRIVSGSDDGTIRIWSAHDGTLVAGSWPFEGHTHWVLSVAYSPDGTRIVSGSDDGTIQVWSAHNGTLVAGPFEGHTHWVLSVAYSPDGTRIVSGSHDRTIRVWSAHDGTLVAGPFEGHTDSVRSVAYSPDSTRIVSGSDDGTIQVWSAHDGTLVAGPFEGHTDSVRSVAYSPDGTRIVSGSHDRTIRVWSAHDGTLVAGPFEGHTHWVLSVAYSPDGTCIVSGSHDRTIRVLSAHDGTLVAGPFEGHTHWVLSVAYSPDSTRIVSGSHDRTIRVWSAHDGTLVAGPFEGHTDSVLSVTYSPDGTRIVSGSHDGTIRVRSAHDRRVANSPPEWDTTSIRSSGNTSNNTCTTPFPFSHPATTQATNIPNPDHMLNLNAVLGRWTIEKDGWVVNPNSQLLFCVPPEFADVDILPTPENLLIIQPAAGGSLSIDYSNVLLGEEWPRSYQPE